MWEDLFRNPLHLITLLAIVMLFFGGKRISEVGGSLGKGIRDFKREIRDDSEEATATNASQEMSGRAITRHCTACGVANAGAAKYCIGCGGVLSKPVTAA